MILSHVRNNIVGYVALAVALGTGTAYAAVNLPNGSVTASKLHTNAVTSTKVKNGSIKTKDLRKPAWVQSNTLVVETPPPVPDQINVAPYDVNLPKTARTSVTVFLPAVGGNCDNGNPAQPTIGLYIDNVAIPATAATVPASGRPVQLTTTLELGAGVRSARVGITCPGASQPNVDAPGAKTWTIIQADD